jgi:hypothetical protein
MAPSTPNPNFDKDKLEESLRHQAPEHESEDREVRADDVQPGAGAEPPFVM